MMLSDAMYRVWNDSQTAIWCMAHMSSVTLNGGQRSYVIQNESCKYKQALYAGY